MTETITSNTAINHDQLFKQLLETFFTDFIELFAPALSEYLNLTQLTFLPQQYFTDILDGDRKAIDLLVQVPVKSSEISAAQPIHTIIIHIENQSFSQAKFAQRMFLYFAELFREYRTPIYPIAVLSFDEPKRLEPNQFNISLPRLDILNFKFQAIQLNQLHWREFLQYQNPIAAALMAKMNIAKKDRPKVKVECLRLLVNLQLDPARTFFLSGFIETYLRLNQREARVFQKEIATIQPVAEQERIMQLTNSWVEQGKSQGLEEERRSAISSLLQFRYGGIDSQLSAVLPVLVTLTSDEYTPLILQLSREELIDVSQRRQCGL
jgi:hypothetical protein